MKKLLHVLILFMGAGCSDSPSSGENGDTGITLADVGGQDASSAQDVGSRADAGIPSPLSGQFSLTILDVDDQCFDGGMNQVLLPTGEPLVAGGLELPPRLPAAVTLNLDAAPFEPASGVADVDDGGVVVTFAQPMFAGDVDQTCFLDVAATLRLEGSGAGVLELEATSAEGCAPVLPCWVRSNVRADEL